MKPNDAELIFLFSYSNGRNKDVLSILSGSVINGRKAAPPSLSETTNFTADQTAIL